MFNFDSRATLKNINFLENHYAEWNLNDFRDNPKKYTLAVEQMLLAEEMKEAAGLLQSAAIRVDETGYDNWNGGTTIWTVYLLVAPAKYARLGDRRETLEGQIGNRLKPILEQYTADWYRVKIAPRVDDLGEDRLDDADISIGARNNIFDEFRIGRTSWSGVLDEVEFLQRLYDLENLPSYDHRFKNAARDIWQHRVNNPSDWADDWVFADSRFNLMRCSSEEFLRFICEMVHPVVRPDRDEAANLVKNINDHLRGDGWGLFEKEAIAGRPRFAACQLRVTDRRSVTRARSVADALDAGWMQKEIERLENAVERDPALAIGTAKDLLETCCKSILSKRGIEFDRKMDLPELTKRLTKELKLVPEGIPDQARDVETIRLILRNLSALAQYLAELRGLYGSGHGREGSYRGLEARHARLAVGAAVAFIDFVTDTHRQRAQAEKDVS